MVIWQVLAVLHETHKKYLTQKQQGHNDRLLIRTPRIGGSHMATEYLTIEELSALLGRNPRSIINDRVRNPAAVPPAIKLPNTRVLIWRREDVDAFLAEYLETRPAQQESTNRRRERPRKS